MKVIFVLCSIELAIYIQKLDHLNSNVVFVLGLGSRGHDGFEFQWLFPNSKYDHFRDGTVQLSPMSFSLNKV